jgi:hypothetical protein
MAPTASAPETPEAPASETRPHVTPSAASHSGKSPAS